MQAKVVSKGKKTVRIDGLIFTRRDATALEFRSNFEPDYVRELPSGAVVRVFYATRGYATGRPTRYEWRAHYYAGPCWAESEPAFTGSARSPGRALRDLRYSMRERLMEV